MGLMSDACSSIITGMIKLATGCPRRVILAPAAQPTDAMGSQVAKWDKGHRKIIQANSGYQKALVTQRRTNWIKPAWLAFDCGQFSV